MNNQDGETKICNTVSPKYRKKQRYARIVERNKVEN